MSCLSAKHVVRLAVPHTGANSETNGAETDALFGSHRSLSAQPDSTATALTPQGCDIYDPVQSVCQLSERMTLSDVKEDDTHKCTRTRTHAHAHAQTLRILHSYYSVKSG